MVGRATGFVCHGQFWLIGQPILSGMLLLIGSYDHVAYFMSYRAGLNIRQIFNAVLGLV